MFVKSLTRRQFIHKSGLSLLGAAVVMNSGSKVFASAVTTPFEAMRFAVISDPHVDIHGVDKMKMSAHSVECLRRTVADLNKEEDLSFVMVNGDLLLDGERENAEVVRDALGELKVKSLVVSGNHDYAPANLTKRREGFSYLTAVEFREFFADFGYGDSGTRYYARQVVPGVRMLALDACLPGAQKKWGGLLSAEQLGWLDGQLASHADQVNLIFMHHNFIPWSVDELKGGPKQWFCIDNAVEVRAVLEKNSKSNPIAMSGHRHIGLRERDLNGVHYFALPSLNSHPMRYSVFTLSNEKVSWKTPMVAVDEATHLQARESLLQATWWRDERYRRKSSHNDMEVLRFYENNSEVIGSHPLIRG